MNLMTFKGKLVFILGVVLTITFLIIGIAFNTIMTDAILTNAQNAIIEARSVITTSNRLTQRSFISTQIFSITPTYEVLDSQFPQNEHLLAFQRMIAHTLYQNDIQPSPLIHELRVNDEIYFLNVVANPNVTEQWIVLYISMTTLTNLGQTLNAVLFIIIGWMFIVSMLLVNFIASSLTLPLTQIAEFATSIGKGNRAKSETVFYEQELIQIQNAMNSMVHNLDEQEQANRHFFQNVSHDLRTPLQVIIAQTEAFEYNFVSKEQTIEVITHQGERLKSLIDDLLILSRLEGNITDVVVEPLDMRDVIEEITSSMAILLNERNLALNYRFPKHACIIAIDKASIHKVLTNLLANAIRYAEHSITWIVKDEEHEIEVSIANDGAKIEDIDEVTIFERYTKGRKGQYGIGLSIVKAVMDHYGGRILVNSTDEQTQFSLYFKK